jgi:hypothetical protein
MVGPNDRTPGSEHVKTLNPPALTLAQHESMSVPSIETSVANVLTAASSV